MRKPSRAMPNPIAAPLTPFAWLVFALFGVGLLWLFSRYPGVLAIVTLGLLLAALSAIKQRRQLDALASTRRHDSICTFVRSFDYRQVDTWILRAVYEALQANVSASGKFPLRADDRLKEDLQLDEDDLDLDLLPDIAQRAGRTLEHTEINPHYGQVRTVRDLVMFLTVQPKTSHP